jgi:hypothetical protein
MGDCMKLTVDTLYNIGDTVKIKGASQRFVINNVIAETCPGGTQILYKGLLLYPRDSFRIKGGRIEWVFEKESAINENLLETLDKENWKTE